MRIIWTPYRRGTHDLGIIYAGIVLVFIAGGAFISWFPIQLPVCWFHRVTGIPCLTCGSTRCFIAAAHGDLLDALAWNPLVFLGCTALLIWGLWSLGALWLKWPIPRVEALPGERWWVVAGVIGILAANWVYLICFLPD